MAFAPDVEATVGHRGGGANQFAQLVAGEEPKARLGGKHVNVAPGTRGIDLAVDQQGRGVKARTRDPLEPFLFAGPRVVAARKTHVVDEVEVLAASQGAGNVGKVLAGLPEALG